MSACGNTLRSEISLMKATGAQVIIHCSVLRSSFETPLTNPHIIGNGWAAAGMLRVLATMNQTTLGYQPQFLAAQIDLQNWATEIVNNIWTYQVSHAFERKAGETLVMLFLFRLNSNPTVLFSTMLRIQLRSQILHPLPFSPV